MHPINYTTIHKFNAATITKKKTNTIDKSEVKFIVRFSTNFKIVPKPIGILSSLTIQCVFPKAALITDS